MTYENLTVSDHRGSCLFIGKVKIVSTINRKTNYRLQDFLLVITRLIGDHVVIENYSAWTKWMMPSGLRLQELHTKGTKITLLLCKHLREYNTGPAVSRHAPKVTSWFHPLCLKHASYSFKVKLWIRYAFSPLILSKECTTTIRNLPVALSDIWCQDGNSHRL